MDRKILSFIALAASMLFGIGFVVIEGEKSNYAVIGGVIIALLWISVGTFGRDTDKRSSGRQRDNSTADVG